MVEVDESVEASDESLDVVNDEAAVDEGADVVAMAVDAIASTISFSCSLVPATKVSLALVEGNETTS